MRKLAAVAVGAVMLLAFAGCDSSSSSSGKASGSTTSTAATPASAWVEKWKPTLVTQYGPAQAALLSAIQSGVVADVQSAGKAVVNANAALSTAITNAGPPPAEQAAEAGALMLGLAKELTLVQSVLRTCTGTDNTCQAAVTAYGENNKSTIVPAFTALKAMT
ncbi:MAG: hypothetical protein ACXWA9_16945 [Acidimicrobiia bacterium]